GHGSANSVGVTNVTVYEPHAIRAVRRVGDVEHPHGVAARDEALHEQRAEIAAAAGHEAGGHSSIPCARHQRMLRRMPSSSATAGSYPSSACATEMSQAMFLPISPSTCSCW